MTQIAALLRKPTMREAEITKVKKMRKVVINRCFGGFGLSKEAMDLYCEKKRINPGKWDEQWKFYENINDRDIKRDDPVLVHIIESMGEKANGWAAELAVVEIPYDVKWEISEYDGTEHIAEVHRTWR